MTSILLATLQFASTTDAFCPQASYSQEVAHSPERCIFFRSRAVAPAGNIRLATGDRYTGDFLKGQPHGHGRSVTSGGDKYTGEWREGQRHGKGKCIFANGDKYQGHRSRCLISHTS